MFTILLLSSLSPRPGFAVLERPKPLKLRSWLTTVSHQSQVLRLRDDKGLSERSERSKFSDSYNSANNSVKYDGFRFLKGSRKLSARRFEEIDEKKFHDFLPQILKFKKNCNLHKYRFGAGSQQIALLDCIASLSTSQSIFGDFEHLYFL